MADKNDNLKKRKSFVKGDPRINKEGRPRKLPDLDKLMAEVLGEEKNGMTAGEAILKAMLAKATRGDVKAAQLLLDRGYGKAKETITLNNGVITVEIKED
jgi:hypothetical protein